MVSVEDLNELRDRLTPEEFNTLAKRLPEQMKLIEIGINEQISNYFSVIESERPPTVSGLAATLGITRENLINYPKDAPGAALIRSAYLRAVQYAEERLLSSPSGIIFYLKNNSNYTDQTTMNIATDNPIEFNVNLV